MSEFTIKDSLVSFKSPAVTDITSAKVYFEPVQEGEGDPSPDNVRPITGWTEATLYKTGKNLLDPSKLKNQVEWNIIRIKVKPNTLYTCSSSRSGTTDTLGLYIYFNNFNGGGGSTDNLVSASHPVTIRSTSTGYVYLSQRIGSGDKTFSDVWIQVEVGTEATAYEPYNNGSVLPSEYQEVEYIQGTSNARIDTGVQGNNDDLVISGKVYLNKFSAYQGFFGNYIDEDHNTSRLILGTSANGAVIADINRRAGSSSVTQVGFYAGNVGEFKASKTKLIFNGTEYSYGGVNNATANDTNILLNVSNPASTTSNSELYRRWYYFRINDGDTALRNYIPCYRESDNKPGMYDTVTNQFFASSGTEEFTSGPNVYYDSIPISWETEAGTVYGGYVDLARGEVVAEYRSVSFDGTNLGYYVSSNTIPYWRFNPANSIKPNYSKRLKTLSNQYNTITQTSTTDKAVRITSDNNGIYFYDSRFVDEQTAISLLQDNPVQIVYPLATPITYQLTPQQLQTLKGINNIWGDTNSDTEITYKVADALKITQIRKNILMSQPHVETVTSKGIATFKTDLAAPVKDCKVYFNPVQEGSGDPSPENVRPISGWDGVTVTRCGKNLIKPMTDTDFWGDGWINSNGSITSVSTYAYTKVPLKVQAGTYTISSSNSMGWRGIYASDMNGNKLEFTQKANVPISLTVSEDALLSIYVQRTATDVQLECNSEPTAYEPYIEETSLTIPFPQTIYGGYVDLVKGEVVETHTKIELAGRRWNNYHLYNGETATNRWTGISVRTSNSYYHKMAGAYCSMFTANMTGASTWANPDNYPGKFVFNAYIQLHIVFPHDLVGITSDMTSEQRTTAIKEWVDANNPEVTYLLETPIHHQLTPQTIKTLKGINNIWSNANGNIEIKYWKH